MRVAPTATVTGLLGLTLTTRIVPLEPEPEVGPLDVLERVVVGVLTTVTFGVVAVEEAAGVEATGVEATGVESADVVEAGVAGVAATAVPAEPGVTTAVVVGAFEVTTPTTGWWTVAAPADGGARRSRECGDPKARPS